MERRKIQAEQVDKHVAEAVAAAAAATKREAERALMAERSKHMMVAAAAAAKQEAERIQAEQITKQEAEVGEDSIYPHPCLTPLHVTQWGRGGGMLSPSFLQYPHPYPIGSHVRGLGRGEGTLSPRHL